MNYAEFKEFLTTFLWKKGDAVLINSLDTLITMAEHELNTTSLIDDISIVTTLKITNLDMPLPAGFKSAHGVSYNGTEFVEISPKKIIDLRRSHEGDFTWESVYAISGTTLMLVGPTEINLNNDIDLDIHYEAKVPHFKDTDTSWLADKYLNLYAYAVLKHSGPFLREDERIAIWENAYVAALAAAEEDVLFGNPSQVFSAMPLPRQASVSRGRGRGKYTPAGGVYISPTIVTPMHYSATHFSPLHYKVAT